VKRFEQGANLVPRDVAFEPFHPVDTDDRDAVAIALEVSWITPNIDLVEGEVEIGGAVFQIFTRFIAQVAASFGIQENDRFHVIILHPARRSDSGGIQAGTLSRMIA
jgi:hypothetical protein